MNTTDGTDCVVDEEFLELIRKNVELPFDNINKEKEDVLFMSNTNVITECLAERIRKNVGHYGSFTSKTKSSLHVLAHQQAQILEEQMLEKQIHVLKDEIALLRKDNKSFIEENDEKKKLYETVLKLYSEIYGFSIETIDYDDEKYVTRICFRIDGKVYEEKSLILEVKFKNLGIDFNCSAICNSVHQLFKEQFNKDGNLVELISKIRKYLIQEVENK